VLPSAWEPPRAPAGALEVDAEAHHGHRRRISTIRVGPTIRLVATIAIVAVERIAHISASACSDIVPLVKHVDPLDPTPLYIQLADILREMITSGELPPRAPLPSESYLQQEQGVARGTARQAVRVLREEGLVVTITGRASYVAPRDSEGK